VAEESVEEFVAEECVEAEAFVAEEGIKAFMAARILSRRSVCS